MIEPQLILIIVFSLCSLCVTLGYVKLLLWLSFTFQGSVKFTLSMMVYVVYAMMMVAPLFYMVSINLPSIQNSVLATFLVLFLYGVNMAPSLYVLTQYKERLQIAGYFQERR